MARLDEDSALALAEEFFEWIMGNVDDDVHICRATNRFSVDVLRAARPYKRKALLHEPPADKIGKFVEGLHHDVPFVPN